MVKSKFPDVQIPNIPLHKFIFRNLKEKGNQVVWVESETDKKYTLNETWKISNKISSVLQKRGLKKGDVMAVYLHNCPEYAFMVYGCLAMGVIISTVSVAFTKDELCRQIINSGATYIFTNEELAPKAKLAAIQSGQIKEVFCKGSAPGCTPFEEFLAYTGPEFDSDKVSFDPANDVGIRPYSSGTTGIPKGVNLTHRNLVFNILATFNETFIPKSYGPGTAEHILGLLPFYHISGMFGYVLGSLSASDTVFTMKRFIPELFLKNIEKYKISNLYLVPPLVVFLIKHPLARKANLTSIRKVAVGAAPLSRESEMEFVKLYPSVTSIQQIWGMTELSPAGTAVPFTQPKHGSVGVALPSTEIQVIDITNGKVLGPNQLGELWVRGPLVMKGYHNRPDATRETIDQQGWLHTGDVGYYDKEEYFYLVDRIKELIKVKGLQVAPAELEGVILEHPEVADVGITSVPDERAGELPFAFVVKKPGTHLNEELLKTYVAGKVADYKQLRGGVKFVDQIPKTESGKILRRQLKDTARSSTKSKL